MPLVSSDFLAGLLTNFRAIFNTELGAADQSLGDYKKIATIFPSTSDKESYGWLGAVPAMNEWLDRRQLAGMKEYDYTLTNKHFEATIEVDRNTIEDDKYSLISPRIRGLAMRAVRFFNEKVFSQLDGGYASYNAYDGTKMFADSRTIGASGNIDNYLSGAYSGSEAEIRAAIAAAVQAMGTFKDDKGVYMGLKPDTIVCSLTMGLAIEQALKPGVSGVTRPEAGFVKQLIVSPWIDTDTDDWFFLCTTAEVKPLILQMRKEPEIVALDDPKSEHVFLSRTFLYGVDTRFQVGFGDPRTAIMIHDA